MSVFDYFWNIEMDKDGITFSDAIETLKLDCDRALECLKRAGHPINNNEILTLEQFESLKREYWDGIISELEQKAAEAKEEKEENDALLKCMKYLAEHGMPIKGTNNHKAESKSVLKDRLSEIAKSPTEYLKIMGTVLLIRFHKQYNKKQSAIRIWQTK